VDLQRRQMLQDIVVMCSVPLSTPGLAQQAQQPGRLDPVVVTATRTETPLSQTTCSVAVVTTEGSTA